MKKVRFGDFPLTFRGERLYTPRAHKREEIGVTVCVAAMCEFYGQTLVIGASDRMVTAGDIQFEPQQPKIFDITSSIVIMTAGDSAMQAEILQGVRRDVSMQIAAEPKKWVDLRFAAETYAKHYNEVRSKKAESYVLAPLGLTMDAFISRQGQMSDTFIRQLASELYNFSAPHVEAIITGVDSTGAHIYVANDADISCRDKVGFASIGIGSGHADSQFMFAGHSRNKPYPITVLQTFAAKKRAEVAPGVGEATDMFLIGGAPGTYRAMPDLMLEILEKIYKEVRAETQKAVEKSEGTINEIFKAIAQASTTPSEEQDTPEDGGAGETPSDTKEVRGIPAASEPAPAAEKQVSE